MYRKVVYIGIFTLYNSHPPTISKSYTRVPITLFKGTNSRKFEINKERKYNFDQEMPEL